MKHILHSIAIVTKAQQKIKDEIEREIQKASERIRQKHAESLRTLYHMEDQFKARLVQWDGIKEEFYGELGRTSRDSNDKLRESLRRNQRAKERHSL